jgi:hypothetical protein
MELPSICFKEHCLMKAASHLATVAWKGTRPDDEILAKFETDDNHDVEEKPSGSTRNFVVLSNNGNKDCTKF